MSWFTIPLAAPFSRSKPWKTFGQLFTWSSAQTSFWYTPSWRTLATWHTATGLSNTGTGAGWNLNRDYTKQDAVETRRLAALLSEWMPHVVVDCHTTDGSVHGYELTYDTSRNLGSCPTGPALFARDRFLPDVSAGLFARTGFRTWFYGNFKEQTDPASGWESYPPLARGVPPVSH